MTIEQSISMNKELTMYEKLLSLPLFQGLSQNDITTIIGKVKFHFLKCKNGETIVKQGQTCSQLIFLLDGELSVETNYPSLDFSITEYVSKPGVLEPYSQFGMDTTFNATYRANNDANLMIIDKASLVNKLYTYNVFRLNYINMLSGRIHYLQGIVTHCTNHSVKQEIIQFICQYAQKPNGRIVISIKMEQLADIINETRINVSRVLNQWEKEGLIQLKRKEIEILDFERLKKHILC